MDEAYRIPSGAGIGHVHLKVADIDRALAFYQDVLGFTNQNGISGSFDAPSGVLTLTGTASVANYQTARRTVTYVNTSEAPSTATRTISFVVRDGNDPSNTATRNITVAAKAASRA